MRVGRTGGDCDQGRREQSGQCQPPGAAGEAATCPLSTPEEAADPIVLLASGRARNVTGADFVIDDGLVQSL